MDTGRNKFSNVTTAEGAANQSDDLNQYQDKRAPFIHTERSMVPKIVSYEGGAQSSQRNYHNR